LAVPAAQRIINDFLNDGWQRGPANGFAWAGLVEVFLDIAIGAFLIIKGATIADLFSREHRGGQGAER
jgi:hypothetical protein